VTGGSPSSIDGTLQSTIAGANFFFINPSGVMFGPNAAVNVSGAFAVSTANSLQLADGARFVAAIDADDSLLSTAPVVSFGFLEGATGAIEVRGSLSSAPGQPLTIIGSSVSVAEGAHLDAPNARITLAGVAFPSEVPVPGIAAGATPGVGSHTGTPAGTADGGNVVIRGGRLVVDNAVITAGTAGGDIDIATTQGVDVINGGQIYTTSSGSIQGGKISIVTPALVVDGLDGSLPTRIAAETSSEDPQAKGGNIVIEADSVDIRRGSEISVSTFGAADAGRVDITTGTLRLQGSEAPQFPTQISANAAPVIGTATGAGGQIVIRADTVELSSGSAIQAVTTGDANAGTIDILSGSLSIANGGISTYTAGLGGGGEIRIDSDQITLDGPFSSITALTTGSGNGGRINLTAGTLRLLNDAAISASTYGDGTGGDIDITADAVVLDTATPQPGGFAGITAASKPSFFGEGTGGKGGDITLRAGSLSLQNGVTISASTETMADGGSIDIRARSVTLDNVSSIQSASLGAGRAGTITVRATDSVLLTGQSAISTSAPLSSGGDVEVRSGGELQIFDSGITAQAGPGGGGNVTVSAPQLVYLLNGTLNAQAEGDGGNLNIVDTQFFVISESALISKSSTANGGNITILSDYFFQSQSDIDASAPFGIPGIVRVSAPNVDLSGSLVGLPSNLLGLETQLRPDCGVRLNGNVSTFIVLGRGGLPFEPGGFLPSGLVPLPNESK
jgi:large exoprotein involved in heme utilization and adhesion